MYITSTSNVAYLTGFTGSNGQVVVAAAGDDVLITDARYVERAGIEASGVDVVDSTTPVEVALDLAAADHSGRPLGFEADHCSHRQALALLDAARERGVPAEATSSLVERLRVVKDDAEVARIRAACQVTAEAFAAVVPALRAGRTERALAVAIERAMVDLGAQRVAFDLIVAGGPNGAIPHHEPGDRMLESGDVVTLDIGAMIAGYRSDMTRVVALGDPDPRLLAIHDIVAAAQAAGVAAARAGATCGDVDAAARQIIGDAGHGERFVHGIGHGVGLDIHETPILTREPETVLEAGTVLTVEPGIYVPGLGGVRIEDTIVVAADAEPERLTTSPRSLVRR
jgi:Xaa-Pro aminopeptidase